MKFEQLKERSQIGSVKYIHGEKKSSSSCRARITAREELAIRHRIDHEKERDTKR